MPIGSLVGQHRLVDLFRRMIERHCVPHAVLFCGPEGSGKAAAAISFARALQCSSEDLRCVPCGVCDNCHRSIGLSQPDLTVLFPFAGANPKPSELAERRRRIEEAIKDPYGYELPSPSSMIHIEPVRELIRMFTHGSYLGGWRTAVVLHADRINPNAGNALLKTLEEPPARSIIILTAPSADALLPTIASRCQCFQFPPVSTSELSSHLAETRGFSGDDTIYVAEMSGGNVRLALSIASDEANETQARALRFLTALFDEREFQTFLALEQLATQKQDVFDVLKSAEVWLRDVLHFKVFGADQIINRQCVADVERLANTVTDQTISVMAQQIERVREMNRRNINLQLSLTELWRKTRVTARAGSV